MLGKKIYKTSMLNVFRLIIFAITVFFFNDFYLHTFTSENFQAVGRFRILDVIEYHFRYPKESVTFFFLIIIPAVYYSLIRGTRFHERGFSVNRGIPFLNTDISYEEVKTYKLLHPKHAISIHTKSGDAFIITDNNVERVIAILDQHNIQGNLVQDAFVRLITNYKNVLLMIVSITIFIFVLIKLGVFH